MEFSGTTGLSLHNFASKWRPIESHMRVPLGDIADENEPNARLRAQDLGGVEHVSDPVHHAVGGHLEHYPAKKDSTMPQSLARSASRSRAA